jgi:serine/threonine-protein kinase
MLIAEAKLAAQLNHQNIVQVLDLGVEDKCLFIAMAYVEGFDLNQLLRHLSERRISLPAEYALFMVRETLSAIAYAHRAAGTDGEPLGVVHRDVSPSNILISFEGEVKLCDFGIARAVGGTMDDRQSGAAITEPGGGEAESSRIQRARVAGKSAYMAPEHARGDDIDARADIFATGIVLWELCAGRRLYKGTESEMLEMARAGAVRPLPDRGLPAPLALQAILDRALAVDPSSRYFRAEEMLKDLDTYALANGLMASQLKFGEFLTEHFGEEIVRVRRERESAAHAKLRSEPPPPAMDVSGVMHVRPAQPSTGTNAVSPTAPQVADDVSTRIYLWIAVAGLIVGGTLAWLLR